MRTRLAIFMTALFSAVTEATVVLVPPFPLTNVDSLIAKLRKYNLPARLTPDLPPVHGRCEKIRFIRNNPALMDEFPELRNIRQRANLEIVFWTLSASAQSQHRRCHLSDEMIQKLFERNGHVSSIHQKYFSALKRCLDIDRPDCFNMKKLLAHLVDDHEVHAKFFEKYSNHLDRVEKFSPIPGQSREAKFFNALVYM
jgi:hypothetical protein